MATARGAKLTLRKTLQHGPPNNEIARKMAAVFSKTSKKKLKGVANWERNLHYSSTPISIINSKTCDEIISYLGPSLQKHKGCTIIDINPGSCLWSSKLHDFLKPKRHILMEPDERFVEPFIQPLLKKEGSTYRHTTFRGVDDFVYHVDEIEAVLNDANLIEQQKAPSPSDPRLREENPDILVIANLCRIETIRKGITHGNLFATSMLRQFAVSAIENTRFNKFGLVRTLAWFPEAEKRFALANSELSNAAMKMVTNIGTMVTEVAGCTPLGVDQLEMTAQRPPYMVDAVNERVQKSMKSLGMQIPDGRVANIPPHMTKKDVTIVSPFVRTISTAAEFKHEVEELANITKEWYEETKNKRMFTKSVTNLLDRITGSLKFPQVIPCADWHCKNSKRTSSNTLRVAIDLEFLLRAGRLEYNLQYLRESEIEPDVFEDLRSQYNAVEAQLSQYRMDRNIAHSIWVGHIYDQMITFFIGPQSLLPRDHRAYNPLQISADDFYPKSPSCLLDLTPHSPKLHVEGLADSTETNKTLSEMLKIMYQYPSRSVVKAIDGLGPNAARDLIPQCPSLTDIRKGGRLNPERLKVTMMTGEMLKEAVSAFIEWPFRPDPLQLALQSAELDGEIPAEDGLEEEVTDAEDAEQGEL